MLEVIVPPAVELVTLPDVYDHLRLGISLPSHPDDNRLTRLIRMARQQVETMTRRALIPQTLRYTLEGSLRSSRWGGVNAWAGWGGCHDLPRPILLSVIAVQYYDTLNTLRSIDVANYRVIGLNAKMGGRIEFVTGFTAPQVFTRSDACSVTYTAGYPPGSGGQTSEDDLRAGVPEPIREAVLLLVEQSYNARLPAEDLILMSRVDALIDTYRIPMS